MLNKTRYEMNKRTERPDLVFYQRKLINYIYIPKWFVTRWEKLIIPVVPYIFTLVLTITDRCTMV